jgi:hypothetical protein
MVFRKVYQAKLEQQLRRESRIKNRMRKNCPTNIEEHVVCDVNNIDPEDAPKDPRFAATLSREAQFATLIGYEDAVIEQLQQSEHYDYSEIQRQVVRKTKIPAYNTRVLHKDDINKDAGNKSLKSFDVPTTPVTRAQTSLPDKRLNVNSYESFRKQQLKRPKSSPSLGRSQSRNSQLRITHHLECAMDILDKFKISQGEITTSPRKRVAKIEPMKYCEAWMGSWHDEFITKTNEISDDSTTHTSYPS